MTGLPAQRPDLACAEPSVPAVYALHLAQGVRLCGGSDSQLLNELGELRQKHRAAVENLLDAIADNRVEMYLKNQFRCPN